jgi:hypothetical protein
MVGELVFDDLPVPSHDDRVGQVSHHKVGCLYVDPTAFTSVVGIRIVLMLIPILMRILPQVLNMLENQNFFTLSHSISKFNVLSLSSVSNVS